MYSLFCKISNIYNFNTKNDFNKKEDINKNHPRPRFSTPGKFLKTQQRVQIMAFTLKLATIDCGNIEIIVNENVTLLREVRKCRTKQNSTYIDMTSIGHCKMTATQLRRFYAMWELINRHDGKKYNICWDIDLWQSRNYTLADIIPQPLLGHLKFKPDERPAIITDLAQQIPKISIDKIETNQHTKKYLDKIGYIYIQMLMDLINYCILLGDTNKLLLIIFYRVLYGMCRFAYILHFMANVDRNINFLVWD